MKNSLQINSLKKTSFLRAAQLTNFRILTVPKRKCGDKYEVLSTAGKSRVS